MDINTLIILFTGFSFVVYGLNSYVSKKMISEFGRWGLADKRKIIGAFQLVCGTGICLGLKFNMILILSSAILIIMMLVAIYVRIKIKDNISEILPAIAYLILGIFTLYNTNYI